MASPMSLADLAVVVTRPQPKADAWARRLEALGARPLVAPMMQLAPVKEPARKRAIKQLVLDFDRYQKGIFVSQNAVAYGLKWLEDYWPQLPIGIEYFAVGRSTAEALQNRGLRVSALQNQGPMNSEALLEAPALSARAVRQQRIAIFRGCGGRGLMGQVLRERGAQVDYCELYHRQLPPTAWQQLAQAAQSAGQEPLVVALHSGEALDNYTETLAQLPAADPALERLARAPLLLPGKRMKARAQTLGYRKLIVADNAMDTSMEAALSAALAQASLFSSDGNQDRDR